jgi:CheY-like chemotaxis protein
MTDQQTILLVDDSENDLVLMKMAFLKAGFKIPLQTVNNGEEAIAYLSGEGRYSNRAQFPLPAVILLDLNMPMKSGFEVLEWLRSQPLLPKRIATIVLTASLRPEDVERAFDLGASSYLVKPGAMGDLISMIRCLRDWLKLNHFPPLNEHVKR